MTACLLAACLLTAAPDDPPSQTPRRPTTETATFGGGCFWSMEAVFERVRGVKLVTTGYAGGVVPDPSYPMVCTGRTGHAEVVQIEFDPSVITYEQLLSIFWKAHDPTQVNRQGPDVGTNYRSIILYHDEDQREAAIASHKKLVASKKYRRRIATQLVPMEAFYPAEPYHQDYYRHHRGNNYSLIHIIPKLRKLGLRP